MLKIINTKVFIEKAKNIHGDKYGYLKSHYEDYHKPLIITCNIHGDFLQKPSKHISRKHGCPKCGGSYRPTTQEFIERARTIHGNKFDYSLVKYKDKATKITLICPEHGEFDIIPHNHIWQKSGCLKCSRAQTSNIEKEWIESFKNPNIKTKTSLKINGKFFKPDGIDETTKTIYEFYGDIYHGNPKVFDSLDISPITKEPFSFILNKTLDRERFIKDNGYNLVFIWENDWRQINSKKPVKPKFTQQSKFNNRNRLFRQYQSYVGWDDEEDFSYILDYP